MKNETLENIHENLINGNRRDCVRMIDDYGLYDFWADYKMYLDELYVDLWPRYDYFSDMAISYFRIKNR